LPAQFLDHAGAWIAAADDRRAAGEAAFARPLAHQIEKHVTRDDQRGDAADVERAEPDPRKHFAGLGEERGADGDQENDRPGRGQPHVLFLVTAERLHLIDIGGLEGQDRQRGDGKRRREIAHEAFAGRDIGGIDRHADEHDQAEFGHAHEAGEYDGRHRGRQNLARHRQSFRRQRGRRRRPWALAQPGDDRRGA
jgi:hypothetical protein